VKNLSRDLLRHLSDSVIDGGHVAAAHLPSGLKPHLRARIAGMADPKLLRPEAILEILIDDLKAKGYVK
jgi:hypothetical protein